MNKHTERNLAFAACPDTNCDWGSFLQGWLAAKGEHMHKYEHDFIQEWVNTAKGRVLKSKLVSEVVLFKAEEKYVTCYFEDGTGLLSTTALTDLVESYSEHFMLVHRSCAVSIKHMKSMVCNADNMYLYLHGTSLAVPVSRRMRKMVRTHCKANGITITKIK